MMEPKIHFTDFNFRWQHTPLDEAKNAKHETIVKYLERHVSNKTKILSDSKAK